MSEAADITPPPGFRRHGHEGGFIDRNGPVFVADRPGGVTVIFPPSAGHLNGAGMVSGGVLLLLLDIAMGIAISAHCGGTYCPTIQMNANFIAFARAGATLVGSAEIQRVTRTVAFLSAELRCGDECVASATGVYRMPPEAAAQFSSSDRKAS